MATPYDEATKHASYLPNELLIELAPKIKLFNKDATAVTSPDLSDVGVYFHEYLHFNHNYSTLAGLTQMVLHLKLGYHMTGLSSDDEQYFTCKGSEGAAGGEAFGLSDTLVRYFAIRGDRELPFVKQSLPYRFFPGKETFSADGKIASLRVGQRNSHGDVMMGVCRIGLFAIEESLVFELQRLFCAGIGADEPVPSRFPYLALRKLRDAYCPGARLHDAMRVAIIALNSHRTAEVLVATLRSMRGLVQKEREAAIRAAALKMQSEIAASPIRILTTTIESMFAGRGALEVAATQLAGLVDKMMQQRLALPFFELRVVKRPDAFAALVSAGLCEVLQHFHDGEAVLVTHSPQGNGKAIDLAEARRAMQSHIHFLNRHVRHNEILSTDAVVAANATNLACPFERVCDRPMRIDDADSCLHRPWVRAAKAGGDTCWYGHGVAATFAHVNLPILNLNGKR